MRLTARQREILTGLRDDPECDLVEEGREVWFGFSQTNLRMVNFFLRRCLIQLAQDSRIDSVFKRYEITEWGLRVLVDDSFDPEAELIRLLK